VVFSLLILLILAVGTIAFMPTAASARDRAGYTKAYSNEFNNTFYDPNDYEINTPPAPPTYSQPAPTVKPKPTGSVLGTSVSRNSSNSTSTTNTETAESAQEIKNLTANVLYGEGSFMPSSLIGWIFLAIIILLIVIITRKILGLDQKYHAAPLKHS